VKSSEVWGLLGLRSPLGAAIVPPSQSRHSQGGSRILYHLRGAVAKPSSESDGRAGSVAPAGATDGAFVRPRLVAKPWGREVWWAHESSYAGKILEVTAGHQLSLQLHRSKTETLYLQSGGVIFHLNGRDFNMAPGHAVTVRPGDVHRIEALEDSVLLEVSTPELDDVVRLEDRYGRS